ncbi:polyprenol phosphomannose-dependent alpha 1,6 mannosyltransferase MptB [Actinoplanes sp. NPDC051851]|uniref:polyprenol phosphomannose-dependent alpha 1,6 mannosyltransferase MptB n=1 Tax=Actinoplanes sp. NPDC051851 TaxID=3154753 RepID=UPI003426BD2E
MTIVDYRAADHRLVAGQWLGTAGSGLIVLGGVFAGVGPSGDPAQLRSDAGAAVMVPTAVVYAGMALLTLGWFTLGRTVLAGGTTTRDLIRTGVMWAVPFALSGPIFSRDVYSYLAQGAMTVSGLDPYRFGPSALGGELAAGIPPIWQHTPAPYGPVFLSLAGGVATLTRQELWPGLIAMRLLAVAGVAVIGVAVHRIARECGVDPGAALWLGVLNPLVLLHLVADAHNEAVMLGLLCAGLVLALDRRPLAAAVLITLAGLVKGPALLGLPFVAALWAGYLPGRAPRLRAAGAAALTAAGTAVIVTALTGTGFGWIPALRTPTRARTWMSLTTDLGSLIGRILRTLGLAGADETRQAVWLAGLAAAGVIVLLLLHHGRSLGMVTAFGLAMTALVILSPVVHAWYLLWGVIPIAAAATSARIRGVVAYSCPVLCLLSPPNGVEPGVQLVIGAVCGVGLGVLAYGLQGAVAAPVRR